MSNNIDEGIIQKARLMMYVAALGALNGRETPVYITLKARPNRRHILNGTCFKEYDVWSIDLDKPHLSRSGKLPTKRKIFKATLLSVVDTDSPSHYRAYIQTSREMRWELRGLLSRRFDRFFRFWLNGGSVGELEEAIEKGS